GSSNRYSGRPYGRANARAGAGTRRPRVRFGSCRRAPWLSFLPLAAEGSGPRRPYNSDAPARFPARLATDHRTINAGYALRSAIFRHEDEPIAPRMTRDVAQASRRA